MKKIFTLLLLIPVFLFGQADTINVKPGDLKETSPGNHEWNFTTEEKFSSLETKFNQALSTINTLNALVTMQGQEIAALQNDLIEVGTRGHTDVYDNAYTLKPTDHGKRVLVHVSCTVTCPDMFDGFECAIVRYGSGEVRVNGAKTPSGLNRLNGQYRRAELYYRSKTDRVLNGDLAR